MSKYRLVPVKPSPMSLELQICNDSEVQVAYPVAELKFNPKSRYVISIEVGQHPPESVGSFLKQIGKGLEHFFPKGSFLMVPSRNGEMSAQIYELEDLDE